MSEDAKAPEQLSEYKLREATLAKLTTLYARKVPVAFTMLLPTVLVWMIYGAYLALQPRGFTEPVYLTVSLAFSGLNILLFILITVYQNIYRERLKRLIRLMPDTQRKLLLPGPETDFQRITLHVPASFRNRFPRNRVSLTTGEQAELVARNLDWYLAKPRRLIRFSWVSLLYLCLLLCAFLCYQLTLSPPAELLRSNLTILGFVVLYAVMQEAVIKVIARRHEAIRIEVYREFLIDWFRRHPVDDEG